MATQPLPGVNGAWSLYRQCAATAAFQKSQLNLFTKLSVWLGITGAAIGTVSQYISTDPHSMVTRILGTIGSLAVALAGLAATQAVAGRRDKIWIRCRAAGETLKSAVFLYGAFVPPFDTQDRAALLGQRVEKVMKELEGTDLRTSDSSKEPPGSLTAEQYIAVRVEDQINWYKKTGNKHQRNADFWHYVALAGAVVSVALGTISGIFSVSPWLALLATVTTSITAYVKGQRYESTIGLYLATAVRLQLLKDQWLDSGKTDADKAERDSFIRRCEETMSLENGAWTAQWAQDRPQTKTAGA